MFRSTSVRVSARCVLSYWLAPPRRAWLRALGNLPIYIFIEAYIYIYHLYFLKIFAHIFINSLAHINVPLFVSV